MILVPFPKLLPSSEVKGLLWGPYAQSVRPHMEPDGIVDAMLEGGCVAAALAGKNLMPCGNNVPEGENLRVFQSVTG